jgi:hypothetical protein
MPDETRRNFFTTALGTLGGLLLSRKAAAEPSARFEGSKMDEAMRTSLDVRDPVFDEIIQGAYDDFEPHNIKKVEQLDALDELLFPKGPAPAEILSSPTRSLPLPTGWPRNKPEVFRYGVFLDHQTLEDILVYRSHRVQRTLLPTTDPFYGWYYEKSAKSAFSWVVGEDGRRRKVCNQRSYFIYLSQHVPHYSASNAVLPISADSDISPGGAQYDLLGRCWAPSPGRRAS